MNKLVSESVSLLREMVAVPSQSFNEGEVCMLILQRLREWGIDCTRIGNNILARNMRFDEKKPTLVLDAHIDTVPASAEYTRDPLDAGDDPGIVFGLGSNDDGGCVVSLAAAFRYFYEKEMPVNIALALSCEEERSGCNGAAMLYRTGILKDWNAKWAIIGEPTQMRAATSERGLLVLDATAHGESGHAARNEGVNALYIAMDDIAKLRSHNFERISPSMGEVKLTVTQIYAGSAHNVVPDKCEFVIDIRPTEQYSNVEILDELKSLCKSELKARNLNNCSSATFEDSPLCAAAESLGISTFSSPTTSNWMITGLDAIKIGPGDSSRSHRADEYILVSEIENGVDTYIRLIDTFIYGYIME